MDKQRAFEIASTVAFKMKLPEGIDLYPMMVALINAAEDERQACADICVDAGISPARMCAATIMALPKTLI